MGADGFHCRASLSMPAVFVLFGMESAGFLSRLRIVSRQRNAYNKEDAGLLIMRKKGRIQL